MEAQLARALRLTSALPPVPVPKPDYLPVLALVGQQAPDPLTALVRAYDRAIGACEAFDDKGARDAIRVLRCALELDSYASKRFDALYAWCEESVACRDFVGAAQCLRSLRNAWLRAAQPARSTFPRFRSGQRVC